MRYALSMIVVGLAGCIETGEPAFSYFRRPEPLEAMPSISPAATEIAVRVDSVGRQLLAANPQIGAKPMFHTIGAPHAEIFHRGTTEVFVTEGLVKQCATDGQLAAVLSVELGKLIRDREASVPNAVRTRDSLPPMDDRLGWDDHFGGNTDSANWKDAVDYDKQRKLQSKRLRPPEPTMLARDYHARAGFDPRDFQSAQPILQQANSKDLIERQLTAPTTKPADGPF